MPDLVSVVARYADFGVLEQDWCFQMTRDGELVHETLIVSDDPTDMDAPVREYAAGVGYPAAPNDSAPFVAHGVTFPTSSTGSQHENALWEIVNGAVQTPASSGSSSIDSRSFGIASAPDGRLYRHRVRIYQHSAGGALETVYEDGALLIQNLDDREDTAPAITPSRVIHTLSAEPNSGHHVSRVDLTSSGLSTWTFPAIVGAAFPIQGISALWDGTDDILLSGSSDVFGSINEMWRVDSSGTIIATYAFSPWHIRADRIDTNTVWGVSHDGTVSQFDMTMETIVRSWTVPATTGGFWSLAFTQGIDVNGGGAAARRPFMYGAVIA